jgi:DNA gyrase/topoisomerase IV subunit A
LGYWGPNYDGSKSEPVIFVPTLPALLITGAQGIASGYASNHIPHNLDNVVKATVAWIKNNNLTDAQFLAKFTNPPEPAQGGRVKNLPGIKEVILTGRGQVEVWGDWEVKKVKWGKRSTRHAIVINKLANGSSEKFLEQVKTLADSEKLEGLIDAADHSNLDGVDILLIVKTEEHIDSILSTLLKSTGLNIPIMLTVRLWG